MCATPALFFYIVQRSGEKGEGKEEDKKGVIKYNYNHLG